MQMRLKAKQETVDEIVLKVKVETIVSFLTAPFLSQSTPSQIVFAPLSLFFLLNLHRNMFAEVFVVLVEAASCDFVQHTDEITSSDKIHNAHLHGRVAVIRCRACG